MSFESEIELKIRENRVVISKLKDIAEMIEDNIDFIDYWYNFCIWDEKVRMDSSFLYWRNAVGPNITLDDFGSVYIAIKNKHPDITAAMKLWFVNYTQYWIYYRNITSKVFVQFYGISGLETMIYSYSYYHCYGELVFIEEMENRLGCIIVN